MKITIVSPIPDMTGGCRVIAIYADWFARFGHEVTIVTNSAKAKRGWSPFAFLKRAPSVDPLSHFDRLALQVHRVGEGRVTAAQVPDADAVIATWWETAEWVNDFPASKGRKFYLIQHHEIHPYLPLERVQATYRMPLQKVVIARWLADVMEREYDDAASVLVSNSVDHDQFFAPPRQRQSAPTVGLLYSGADWKRFDLSMAVLENIRVQVPGLRVVSFGSERPKRPMPEFVSFSFEPRQNELRNLYASCDVWLTASVSEGFNLTAMEAMACRTPVVSTRTGWPAEAIVNGENGFCVAVDDAAALQQATERVLNLTPNEWARMSERAFETVRESTWERSARQFEQVLVDGSTLNELPA